MTFKERLAKLVDVKSIVTILLTGVFCYLSIAGTLPPEFITIYSTVTAFYFGVQYAKKGSESNESKSE